jgi:aconitase B
LTPATLLRAGCPLRVCQGDVHAVVQEQLVDDVLMMGGEAATRDG